MTRQSATRAPSPRSLFLALAAAACLAGCGPASIHEAARQGDAQTVQRNLEINPRSVASKDGRGMTPLHWAARGGHAESAKILLAGKAPLDATRPDNRGTPLHEALEAGQPEVAALLASKGAPLSATTKNGETPLAVAARQGALDSARALLERGAPLQTRDDKNRTPLCAAPDAQKAEFAALFSEFLDRAPPADAPEAAQVLRDAIAEGAPVYNAGNQAACANIYEQAAIRLMGMGGRLPAEARSAIVEGLKGAGASSDFSKQAWAFRSSFNETLKILETPPAPAAMPKPAPAPDFPPPVEDDADDPFAGQYDTPLGSDGGGDDLFAPAGGEGGDPAFGEPDTLFDDFGSSAGGTDSFEEKGDSLFSEDDFDPLFAP